MDIAAGQPFTVNINRYSADYVHDIAIKVGGNVVREAKGYGEKVTFSSKAIKAVSFAALDGSLSKACTVVLTTRSGNTEIGSASYPALLLRHLLRTDAVKVVGFDRRKPGRSGGKPLGSLQQLGKLPVCRV